jgi:hypothetical protein
LFKNALSIQNLLPKLNSLLQNLFLQMVYWFYSVAGDEFFVHKSLAIMDLLNQNLLLKTSLLLQSLLLNRNLFL